MAFTKFTNLDYDQIRQSVKDYLRANSNFSGFDFDGSNFSVLIDSLSYIAYINAVNANMIVNESFLDSATLRRNVVSLAGNIGYVPRSRKSATAKVKFTVTTNSDTPTLTLKAGLVAVGSADNTDYVFSIPEDITTTVVDGVARFGTDEEPIDIFQGTYITSQFTVDGSLDQRFIINNSSMDYSTLIVRIQEQNEQTPGNVWAQVKNIVGVDADSEIYFINEVEQEKYELIFGDGVFGKELTNGQVINASYILSNGKDGNGPSKFAYAGSVVNSTGGVVVPTTSVSLTTLEAARNGSDIESVESIKYYAPKLYSAQYRAVTPTDYEAIIKQIYPKAESISVVGGEELNPPQFGNVIISIKPSNGLAISEFDKKIILDALKQYSIAGITQRLVDLAILYVEIDSFVYYDDNLVSNAESLRTSITNSLNSYSTSVDLNKFGGRFKYSRMQKVIDETNTAVTSNITRVIVRRNLSAVLDVFAQYELCYGNSFFIDPAGSNIKSTGFRIFGVSETVYLTDKPNKDLQGNLDGSNLGKLSIFAEKIDSNGNSTITEVVADAGIIDYAKGEVKLSTIRIVSTSKPDNVIEVQAVPSSNDVIGLKDLYVAFSVSESTINMVKDTISSGEQISGVGYKVTPSYSNKKLTR